MKTKNVNKGFTLIEVLLVIVLIGILLSIGLVNFNSEARLVDARNDIRKTHIQTLESTITQYKLQKGSYPAGLTRDYQEICDPDATSCTGFIDLKSSLVPDFIQAIPQDPNDTDNTGGSGYEIAVDEASNTVSIRLKEALREGGVEIKVNDPLPNLETSSTNTPLAATVPQLPPESYDFTISPAVSGKNQWNLDTDGQLNLGTYNEWTITPLKSITVSVKMWGAGGASGANYATSIPLTETSRMGTGGGGGYSTGVITMTPGNTYILQVGQGGGRRNSIDINGGATYLAGGSNSNLGAAQGGGYSGIFKNSVIQSNALIIAGGGGGGYDTSYGSASGQAGAGGGNSGQNGPGGAGTQGGGGGTQSSGGIPSIYHGATVGNILRGGLAGTTYFHAGGGGGGYFGGGGGNVGGGGGGSGFVHPSLVISGSTQTGHRATPANSTDPMRSGSGQGSNNINKASDGRIIIVPI